MGMALCAAERSAGRVCIAVAALPGVALPAIKSGSGSGSEAARVGGSGGSSDGSGDEARAESDRLAEAKRIVETYVRVGAPREVHIDVEERRHILDAVERGDVTDQLFARAAAHALRVMEGDSFLRFKHGHGMRWLVRQSVLRRYGVWPTGL
jgi:hypothetical protein